MCKFDAIPCTNHCGAMIPRLLMEDHLLYTCPKRRTRCEYCSRDFTGETLEVRNHSFFFSEFESVLKSKMEAS